MLSLAAPNRPCSMPVVVNVPGVQPPSAFTGPASLGMGAPPVPVVPALPPAPVVPAVPPAPVGLAAPPAPVLPPVPAFPPIIDDEEQPTRDRPASTALRLRSGDDLIGTS